MRATINYTALRAPKKKGDTGLQDTVLGKSVPGKSMVPLLSASTSLIMSCSSDSEGFWPSERMTVPSSLVVIWPDCNPRVSYTHSTTVLREAPSIHHSGQDSLQPCTKNRWGEGREEESHHRHPCPTRGKKTAPLVYHVCCWISSFTWEIPMLVIWGTHKQGEGLLVLGNLLFGQRIGLDRKKITTMVSCEMTRQPTWLPRFMERGPRDRGQSLMEGGVQLRTCEERDQGKCSYHGERMRWTAMYGERSGREDETEGGGLMMVGSQS